LTEENYLSLNENVLAELSLYKELLNAVESQNRLIGDEDIDGALGFLEVRDTLFKKIQDLVSLQNRYRNFQDNSIKNSQSEIDSIIRRILDLDQENQKLFRVHADSLCLKITAIANGKKLAHTYSSPPYYSDAAFVDKKK